VNAIVIDKLRKRYGDICAIDGVPFEVSRGRRYTSGMVRRVDSLSGAEIQLARKKQILMFSLVKSITFHSCGELMAG
jgi:hypothetical protein